MSSALLVLDEGGGGQFAQEPQISRVLRCSSDLGVLGPRTPRQLPAPAELCLELPKLHAQQQPQPRPATQWRALAQSGRTAGRAKSAAAMPKLQVRWLRLTISNTIPGMEIWNSAIL